MLSKLLLFLLLPFWSFAQIEPGVHFAPNFPSTAEAGILTVAYNTSHFEYGLFAEEAFIPSEPRNGMHKAAGLFINFKQRKEKFVTPFVGLGLAYSKVSTGYRADITSPRHQYYHDIRQAMMLRAQAGISMRLPLRLYLSLAAVLPYVPGSDYKTGYLSLGISYRFKKHRKVSAADH